MTVKCVIPQFKNQTQLNVMQSYQWFIPRLISI